MNLISVSTSNFQQIQQVTKAYEILADMCETEKNYAGLKENLIKAKENQKKLLKRVQLEEGDIVKNNQKLYCQ